MVKLRAAHKTLKIVLCCVLGAAVAAGGTAGIVMLSKTIHSPEEPDLITNTKVDPDGLTPDEAAGNAEEANTLYYLAYVLDSQDSYSAYAVNESGSLGFTSTTRTFKDYSDGVMIASDITSGVTQSAMQTCYIKDDSGDTVAYRRSKTEKSSVNSSSTVSTVTWDDTYSNTYYYYRTEDYLTTYGEFSTEMTVYLINENTIESYSGITQNEDGTYSQTFVFNDSAGWWYQYAMYTNGGLNDYPEFDKIEMTVTFDSSWRVLSIDAEDVTQVSKWAFNGLSTTSTTTTTFSYGSNALNEENYGYYESYYKDAMPYATNGSTAEETDDGSALAVLMAAFDDALGSSGDQFAVTLDMGGQTYYGYIYLKINIKSEDILNDLDIRLALSADETCDSQDLYIELKNGNVNAYYSSNFALTADISDVSSVISQFTTWINNFSYGASDTGSNKQAASVKLTADDSSSFDLSSLLGGIAMTESDGIASITLALEDLYGIDAYVQIDVTVTETTGEDGSTTKTYAFKSAYIGDLSYNGNAVELELSLAPANAATISRNADKTAFDLAEAMSSIYALLNSTSIQVDLSLEGAKIVTLANSLLDGSEYTDYIALLSDYDIKASAIVDIHGITTQANVQILKDSGVVIDLDIYYAYDKTSTYGIAYLTVNTFMGKDCSVKAYCDISDLVDGINKIIALAEGETGISLASEDGTDGTEEGTDNSAIIVAVINAVLGLDFSECITVTAQDKTVTAALDVDNVIDSVLSSIVGINMTFGSDIGEIGLTYSYSTDESNNVLAGTLTLDANTVGIGLAVTGSSTAVTEPDKSEYLDLTETVESVYELLCSDTIQLDLAIDGGAVVNIVNSATDSAYASYLSILNGYDVIISATVDTDGTVQANVVIASDGITVLDASIYYAYDGTSAYGTAYLKIVKFMNVDCSVKVYCDIADLADSINDIITIVQGATAETVAEDGESLTAIDIIKIVLGLDYTQIIDEITVDSTNGIYVSVDADAILSMFLEGITLNLGNVALGYSYTTVEGAVQAGELSLGITGVTATIKAGTEAVTEPAGTYVDLTYLANSVANAAAVAMDIAEDGASFEISGEIEINGSAVSVDGTGEVVLETAVTEDEYGNTVTNTSLKSVAVDVTLAVTNGLYGCGSNDIRLQVVYLADNFKAAAEGEEEQAFLYVVINGSGMAVTYSQYTAFTAEVSTLYSVISSLLASSSGSEQTGSSVSVSDEDILTILNYITGIFADEDMMAKVNSVAALLNNFTITVDENGNIAVVYADEESSYTLNVATITTADGKLTLASDIADLYAGISAYDGTADLAGSLVTAFADTESYTMTNLDGMVSLLYGYVFRCIDEVDIESVFGSSAYQLALTLDGDASGISALEGVTVDVTATAGAVSGKNIYTLNADMDISGFTVDISMVYYDSCIYLNISDIGGIAFTDLSVKASADDIYSLAESAAELILNEDVLALVSAMLAQEDGTELTALTADGEGASETKSTLTAVLEMLTAILDGSVITVDADGGQLVLIDIDGILAPYGISAGAGTLAIDKVYTGETVTGISAQMTVTDETEGTSSAWLTLTANGTDSAQYTTVDTQLTAAGGVETTFYAGSYMDIGFVSQIVTDIAAFVKDGLQTDSGTVTGAEYTFTGDIEVAVSVSILSTTITISGMDITVGYTADGELYLRVFGKVNANSLADISENYIGISYSSANGLISLARGLNSDGSCDSDTIYWIMTMADFMDKMFAEDSDDTDSPIRWLLNMGSNALFWVITGDTSIWNSILSLASLEGMTSSGLGDGDEYYLYNTSSSGSSIDIFGSSSYIASFVAMLTGGTAYSYGDYSSMVSTLGLDGYADGYYAFALGTGLLGDDISPVYMALTRSGDYGFGNIIAYAAMSSYLTVNANFEYKGSGTGYTTSADDYYTMALDSITDGSEIDWVNGSAVITKDNTETYYYYQFGSVKIENGTINKYYDSYTLVDGYVKVTIYEWDGENNCYVAGQVVKLRYGSTVYLYTLDGSGIVIDDATGKAVVYTTADYLNSTTGTLAEGINDDDLPTSVTVYEDTALYEYVTSSTVYTVNIYDSYTGGLISKNYVFGTQNITELYGDYTLVGSLYSDEECKTIVDTSEDVATIAGEGGTTLDLYGRFAQNSVTVNGVVYTFCSGGLTISASNSSNEADGTTIATDGGYYLITGYTAESYAEDEWLTLENEIGGFKVLGVAEDALKGSAITNVVVPDNICYIAYEAFNDCTSLANIVFLADTIYLNNNGGRTSYPFVGCNSTLNIYCNNYIGLGESSSSLYYYAFNTGSSSSSYSYITPDTDWTYLSSVSVDTAQITGTFTYTADQVLSDVNAILQDCSYNANLYTAYGAYFYTDGLDMEAAIEKAVLANINAYTADTYGYINGYNVAVTVKDYAVTVTVTETDNEYYVITVGNLLYNTESESYDAWTLAVSETASGNGYVKITYTDGDSTVTVTYTGAVQIYDGELYATKDVEITGSSADYRFVDSLYISYAAVLYWEVTQKSDYTVNIYTDVAFTLDGISVAAGTTNIDLVTADGTLDSLTVTEPKNYYFLGWAYMADTDSDGTADTLTFTSNITTGSTTYYAIWGYNANVTLTDYSVSSDSTSLPTPTVSNGTFYAWYTNGEFTSDTVSTLQSGVYTYYARMSFTVSYTSTRGSAQVALNNNGNSEGSTSTTSQTGTITIYEGDEVILSAFYTDGSGNTRMFIMLQYYDENGSLKYYYFYAGKRGVLSTSWQDYINTLYLSEDDGDYIYTNNGTALYYNNSNYTISSATLSDPCALGTGTVTSNLTLYLSW